MGIAKKAEQEAAFLRPFISFPSARAGFKWFLSSLALKQKTILVPAYIGISPKEGSGILDPIIESGFTPVFYRHDANLCLDLEQFKKTLDQAKPGVALFVHYFGFVDPGFQKAHAFAVERGLLTVEDEAHALYSDVVNGVCGRLGDVSLVSLHKMLPMKAGGGVFLNNPKILPEPIPSSVSVSAPIPWTYDLRAIATRRLENARALMAETGKFRDLFEPLPRNYNGGEVPQTFPVIIKQGNRDAIYEAMNRQGIGVVSLYHTLVRDVPIGEFPEEHRLSRRILNLPVHQDLRPGQMADIVAGLVSAVRTTVGS